MAEVLTVEQVENEALIANSFEGHEGRPGERGGSVARGDQSFREKQTETPAFKSWFGDSKVVDAGGKPLVVFKAMHPYDYTKEANLPWGEMEKQKTAGTFQHGPLIESIDRKEEFPAFNHGEKGVKIAGFFGDKETANRFTQGSSESAIYPCYLKIEKPFVIDAKGGKAGNIEFGETGKPFRDAIRSGKYDGVIIKNTEDEHDVYVALHPTQIKSAIGNKGTWSKTDPSIVNESPERGVFAANADTLDKPFDFKDALLEHSLRPFLPTTLSHSELQEQVEPQIRERALMMARVTNAEYGEKVRELCASIEQGKESLAGARIKLGRLAAEMGYEPEAGKEGTIEDLGSDARLDLILRTQVEMADGYGQWKGRQEKTFLEDNPCLEFYRAFDRKEPRDWPARWAEAGGEFFDGDSDYAEGRMIARADSPIWEAISAFGTPYPPFDFNSGMMTEPVDRDEAVELGVIQEGQVIHPQTRDFAEDAKASVKGLSGDIEQVLLESLGGGWETEDGFLVKANEQMIEQLANSILIANSFEGHAGRPGMRGGSAPSGEDRITDAISKDSRISPEQAKKTLKILDDLKDYKQIEEDPFQKQTIYHTGADRAELEKFLNERGNKVNVHQADSGSIYIKDQPREVQVTEGWGKRKRTYTALAPGEVLVRLGNHSGYLGMSYKEATPIQDNLNSAWHGKTISEKATNQLERIKSLNV